MKKGVTVSEKWKCDFRGCNKKPEVLTSFSDFFPTKNSKHWKNIEGKSFCDTHVEYFEDLMEKEGIVFRKPEETKPEIKETEEKEEEEEEEIEIKKAEDEPRPDLS